jgi:type III secretion system (T3SS) inner membrane Yop/YscD-like protein
MPKFCSNGHQMEDSWEVCPYCQKTGYQMASTPAGKTRLEPDPVKPPGPTAPAARKTVLLSDLHKPPVVGWFVAMDGEQKGEDFRIRDGQNIIGSAPDADIVLRDATISGKHASLRYKDQKFFLTDLDSTNGTFLNNEAESIAREQLKDNDTVRIGAISLKFKCL